MLLSPGTVMEPESAGAAVNVMGVGCSEEAVTVKSVCKT
jgi:hypothetical protein